MTKTSAVFSNSSGASLQLSHSPLISYRRTRLTSAFLALAVLALGTACDSSSASMPPAPSATTPRAATPTASPAEEGPCPPGMVLVEAYCIDRYEAHLEPVNGHTEHIAYQRPKQGVTYAARSKAGVVPQGYVSREEASRACRAAGKRLCSAREWQTACKGRAGFKYPYGRDEAKGRCNTRKTHLPAQLFGIQPTGYREPHLNDPRLNREPGFLARTGQHPECVSDYGVFDMVGNLHEWVADDVNGKLPGKIPIPAGVENLGRRGNGIFMGGFFSSGREHGRGCEYVTTHHAPDYHDYSTGFRCCKDP